MGGRVCFEPTGGSGNMTCVTEGLGSAVPEWACRSSVLDIDSAVSWAWVDEGPGAGIGSCCSCSCCCCGCITGCTNVGLWNKEQWLTHCEEEYRIRDRWTVSTDTWEQSRQHKMNSMTELAGVELCLPQRPHNQVGAASRRRRRNEARWFGPTSFSKNINNLIWRVCCNKTHSYIDTLIEANSCGWKPPWKPPWNIVFAYTITFTALYIFANDELIVHTRFVREYCSNHNIRR